MTDELSANDQSPSDSPPTAPQPAADEGTLDEAGGGIATPDVDATGADREIVTPDLDAIEADLDGVEAALDRLAAGTYWTDEVTGQPIDDDVLDADPTARRSPT